MSAATKEIRPSAEQLIELLKQLPQEKQEFINGYVQGTADALQTVEKSA